MSYILHYRLLIRRLLFTIFVCSRSTSSWTRTTETDEWARAFVRRARRKRYCANSGLQSVRSRIFLRPGSRAGFFFLLLFLFCLFFGHWATLIGINEIIPTRYEVLIDTWVLRAPCQQEVHHFHIIFRLSTLNSEMWIGLSFWSAQSADNICQIATVLIRGFGQTLTLNHEKVNARS